MNKKAVSIVMMLVLTITISSNAFAAPTTDESAELKQTQDNKKQIQGKVNTLNKQIDDIIKSVDKNKSDMNKIDENIKSTEAKLKDLEEHSKEQDDLFKKRLRALYISGGGSNYLDVILGSKTLSDFISSVDSISTIMKYDNNLASQLQEQKDTITKQKDALNYENNRLSALKSSNEATLANLSNDIKQQNQLLAQATSKENTLIAQQKAEEAAAQAAEKARELAAQQAANASKQIASNNPNSTSSPIAINRGGSSPIGFSKVLDMEATAYSDDGFTASGYRTSRNPNGYSTIAVDPRVIPLGSKVYVEGYGYAIACDTGGAIQGNIIDLFLPSNDEANNWGRRSVKVYIVGN
ncbi:3D domain-containing protein [Clostridium pasteurianum]|uniref:Uncharacterized protein n=1 Tax=Clostridium pasteurianum BC1 TaxID=86416 RepID=R4K5G2_CLOPA|nr:3D domain-containing protein [Clostridium pasteurianum]AGK98397.1 hypothetical protein Clopa_3615 [Clostridium pasteurianum BC1]